jgi:site-specific DNA recombinase
MKAVILARVSSKEQEDGHSLSAQIANLKLYAERRNLNVIKEFTIIESSTKGERPEFARMIEFVQKQKERIALIVDTVDRLQRSFRETPILNDLMEKDYLELHFVKEGNILSKDANSTQKLMWNMGVVMAQSYTDQLSDNVKRSIKHKISNGEWSGPAPLGYLNTDDPDTGRKTIIPDPERGFLIKRLFEEFATGVYSQAELIRKAHGWGLRSKSNNKVSPQTFNGIIQNPFYYGCMKIKGQLVPHIYKPLISKNVFDMCQDIREGRNSKNSMSETKEPFLLRGIIKCAITDKTVTCDLKKGKYVYLICHDPDNPKKKMWVKEETVLEQIKEVFKSIQVPDNVLLQIIDHLKHSHESEKDFHHASIKNLHKESEDISKKQDRLTDLLIDESITKDIYNNKLTQLVNRQQEINQLLEQHHKGNEQFKIALSSLITLTSHAYDIFESSTIDEKRQLMGYMFSNLKLKGRKLEYDLKKPFNLFANLTDRQEWLSGQSTLLTFSTGFESLFYKVLSVGFLFREFSTEQAVITFYKKSIPNF